jgi:hypothetical protein
MAQPAESCLCERSPRQPSSAIVQQEIRVELRVVPRARDDAHIRYSTHAMYQQQVDEFFDRSRGVVDCRCEK